MSSVPIQLLVCITTKEHVENIPKRKKSVYHMTLLLVQVGETKSIIVLITHLKLEKLHMSILPTRSLILRFSRDPPPWKRQEHLLTYMRGRQTPPPSPWKRQKHLLIYMRGRQTDRETITPTGRFVLAQSRDSIHVCFRGEWRPVIFTERTLETHPCYWTQDEVSKAT